MGLLPLFRFRQAGTALITPLVVDLFGLSIQWARPDPISQECQPVGFCAKNVGIAMLRFSQRCLYFPVWGMTAAYADDNCAETQDHSAAEDEYPFLPPVLHRLENKSPGVFEEKYPTVNSLFVFSFRGCHRATCAA